MAKRHVRVHARNNNTTIPVSFLSTDTDVEISSANPNIPNEADTLKKLLDILGALAFEDDIELDEASVEQYGVTILSNDVSDTEEVTKAATTAAVSSVNASAVHTTSNEDIGGCKTFTDGLIRLGDLEISYDTTNNSVDVRKIEETTPEDSSVDE